ncbi:MAG: NADP-specific glutamate dehydrogenase [Opitutales bacterium]
MHPAVARALETVVQRNPGESVFHQAVKEVLETLDPVLQEHPEIVEASILDRIIEPERSISFRGWGLDEKRLVHGTRRFGVQFITALGPYKGGLRFHPSVNLGVIKFLGFEQIFKNSLTGQGIGGGKGGSDFNPRGRSDDEVMRFCQAFMTELQRHIGSAIDVPAGDIGVSGREIGYLFGQYKRLANAYERGVLTGKGTGWGGSQARTQATGYGCVYFARNILEAAGDKLEGHTACVSGSGNVAIYAIEKLQQLGVTVVACSDSDGSIFEPAGLSVDCLRLVKEQQRGRLSDYAALRPEAQHRQGKGVWDIACDLAFPAATQNEVDGDEARQMIANGCKLVCECANMPCTPGAVEAFTEAGVLFGPAKAANAGGVACSALEMQQNAGLEQWTFSRVDQALQEIMREIFTTCSHCARKYGHHERDYIAGANTGGFLAVAQAMLAHGVI